MGENPKKFFGRCRDSLLGGVGIALHALHQHDAATAFRTDSGLNGESPGPIGPGLSLLPGAVILAAAASPSSGAQGGT
jgi:hypothetical protein